MDRCNELCTKETTGQCALCEARAEADRCIQRWFKGGWLIDGVRALKSRGVFAFLSSPFSLSWRTRLILGLVALLLFLGSYQFFWVIPNQQIASVKIAAEKGELTAKEFYELRNSIRQTFAQALGGVALLLGLYFTAQTLRTSQETLRINQATLRVTQEGQVTERFGKAIEHLGDKERLTVRLGGIYALERIARDSPKDHWQIMEVLTAYVRDNAPWPPQDAPLLKDGQALEEELAGQNNQPSLSEGLPTPKPTTDIQAVLTVLGRRIQTPNHEIGFWDASRTDLRKADLIIAHLGRLELNRTDLRGVDLSDAHLEGTHLFDAHLERANLFAVHLERANLFAAHLERATLQGAHLEGASLIDAYLEGADLSVAHLEGADLSVAHLEGADLTSAYLEGANLTRANLERAALQGAKDLTVAQLSTVSTLKGASLDPPLMEQLQREQPHLFKM
jgi:uncharacterized protein YjbI with pentapeptide repeats